MTILIWTKKIGLHALTPPIKRSDDWVLIIDESIAIGHERLLVIYGVRTSTLDFTRALTYQDLTPLFIKASSTWKADIIMKEIENIIKTYGQVKYIVADGGNAICKSIKLLSSTHVYDITHKIAILLRKMYSKDDVFINYTKQMAQMRFKAACSNVAYIIPPKQRIDSRFMNLDILSDWGQKALNYLETVTVGSNIFNWLCWLDEYKDFITELGTINDMINQIKTTLKVNGLSKKTFSEVKKILRTNRIYMKSARVNYLKENLLSFLEETMNLLPKESNLLCTSDIIESSFGKYKNSVNRNPMAGITDLSLSLATFTSSLNAATIKEGLEKTSMKDLSEWSKMNIGETNLSRRKRALKINGV